MVLPFEPLSIAFDEIRYAVDMPQVPSIFNLDAPLMYYCTWQDICTQNLKSLLGV